MSYQIIALVRDARTVFKTVMSPNLSKMLAMEQGRTLYFRTLVYSTRSKYFKLITPAASQIANILHSGYLQSSNKIELHQTKLNAVELGQTIEFNFV